MTKVRIAYRPEASAIVIVGQGVYPARSLDVSVTAEMISLTSLSGRVEAIVAWWNIESWDGGSFSDEAATLAYLNTEVSKSGSTPRINRAAGEAISGHRAVWCDGTQIVFPADASELNSDHVMGVTTGAAAQGDTVEIATEGEIAEPSWNWQPGAIYLGAGGALTQLCPSQGSIVRVGTAAGSTAMIVNPRLIARLQES